MTSQQRRKRRLLGVSSTVYMGAALLLSPAQARLFLAFSPSSPGASPEPSHPPIIKVPTYRLYRGPNYVDQLAGRKDAAAFHRLLSSAMKQQLSPSPPAPTSVIQEVDSLDELDALLGKDPDRLHLVEFYGAWCTVCKEMQPIFTSLPYVYRGVLFCRGEIKRFPQLTSGEPAKKDVVDKSVDVKKRVEGCPRCQGTGFIECPDCQGKGHIIKPVPGKEGAVVADFCPSCTGKKRLPCPTCGGKCYMCD